MEMKNIELLENLNCIQYQINDGIDKVIKYIYLKYIRNKTDNDNDNDNDTDNDKMTLEKFKKSILKPSKRKLNNDNNNNNDSH
jgi:hypothetical protein